ncbi:MAG: TA system VapC family ribonuclease toxin [Nocardioides sp.]
MHGRQQGLARRCSVGGARVGFAWLSLVGFVRLVSLPRLLPRPRPADEAMAQVQEWIAAPTARTLSPTARHASVLSDLLARTGTGGNLVNDAHLAALAIEHRAEIVTYDTDFARFPGVRWSPPSTA